MGVRVAHEPYGDNDPAETGKFKCGKKKKLDMKEVISHYVHKLTHEVKLVRSYQHEG